MNKQVNPKKIAGILGFIPKDNTKGIFQKHYPKSNNYEITIDVENESFNYGNKIKVESKTTLNFSQAENWVIIECVDRLLNKGYQPQNIILEKTWKTGHGTSGRLDILVTQNDGSAYLMIECKTWGAEFDKESKKILKNGGQLFTYFQQDKNADVLMLYSAQFEKKDIEYKNIIIKIEQDHKHTSNVKDFFERWNKLPKTNGIFDSWVSPYEFHSKALLKKDLKVLKQKDSSFIFNRFLEILRHNVVSDKPNAFNKIFTLFLCKIIDEDRNDGEQLHFQWLEGQDDHVTFQKRLTDLYNRGMLELLEKKVTDVSDNEFDKQFSQVAEEYKDKFKDILTEIRLKKNNEFAIKEVYDDASFFDNAKVVKEVVELLQVYQIRYNYRQQFLSDFFELLLTTGLKQESGQFFTPVPVARFIIRSLPLTEITREKIEAGNKNDLLPNIIDYAAGSGHFITESMEEIQTYIDALDPNAFSPTAKRSLKKWKEDQFDWAEDYVYGIEKDYRLVKTAKVSCYLHGDGLAKIIHGDGLGDFSTSEEFKERLKKTDKGYPEDNKQFDVIVSNPPYSVSAFKGLMDEEKSKEGFSLYDRLTDQSSEIECLFVERTKQLLKDGGVAGVILPSSILSNTGIHSRARQIILKYFEILAITEFGSNTFMATGTNTVTLFLRRRNNTEALNIEESIKRVFLNYRDVTISGIESPLQKYVNHVWESISVDDYKTLLKCSPNENIKKQDIYKEYTKKVKAKNEQEFWTNILALEQEKLLYFILAYSQKIVLIKTGEKNAEKQFLGYEFSNRRGREGIHPVQRKKTIDDCTQLYDVTTVTNPLKASTYIYKAFNNEFDLSIPDSLQQNISYQKLVDMLTFDRYDFNKTISLSVKKKRIDSKWNLIKIGEAFTLEYGKNLPQKKRNNGSFPVVGSNGVVGWHDDFIIQGPSIIIGRKGSVGKVNIMTENCYPIDTTYYVVTRNHDFIFEYSSFLFKYLEKDFKQLNAGLGPGGLNRNDVYEIKIPLPPQHIQEKIVAEIRVLEQQQQEATKDVRVMMNTIYTLLKKFPVRPVSDYCTISVDKENPQKKSNCKYSYIGLEHIESNTGNVVMNEEFGRNILSTKNKFLKGDILYGKLRPYLNKVATPNFNGICSTDILVLKTNIPKLLKYALCSDEFVQQTTALMKGLSLPRIKPNDFLNLKVSIPPIAEQDNLTVEIEQLEQNIAALEKKIELIPEKKEKVLKKYL